MGVIRQAMGDEDEAEEYFNKTLYLNPNHEEALAYLALIAENRGDIHNAFLLRQRIRRINQ